MIVIPHQPRVTFDAKDIGITLKTDDKTLREIEGIRDEAVKAMMSAKRFIWR
jgi:hypothetical protein